MSRRNRARLTRNSRECAIGRAPVKQTASLVRPRKEEQPDNVGKKGWPLSKNALGEFEKLVMLALLHLGQEAYGAPIIQELEERTGRTLSAGAVYVALRRLEKKALVTSRLGSPSPQRGGRPKRYFSVNPSGLEALRRAQEDWTAMVSGLREILEPSK
jgi:DNA-binding PadR family transcriptional regulator